MRPWEEFVTPEERARYQKAGYTGQKVVLGERPALMIIDVTAGYIGGLAHDKAMQSAVACPGSWEAVEHISMLLALFRERQSPVVYTTGDYGSEKFYGGATKRPRGADDLNPDRDTVPPAIAPADSELVLKKTRASIFFDTPLAVYLRRLGVDTLFITGTSTSGCVRASVVDAFSLGFRVLVVEEAVFDRARTLHMANLFDMNAKYAEVITMQQAVKLLTG